MKTGRLFFKELRIRQLRALMELSRQKTFSAAASLLGLSVVSAWRQVRSLEEASLADARLRPDRAARPGCDASRHQARGARRPSPSRKIIVAESSIEPARA
jgi:hypothetical protein